MYSRPSFYALFLLIFFLFSCEENENACPEFELFYQGQEVSFGEEIRVTSLPLGASVNSAFEIRNASGGRLRFGIPELSDTDFFSLQDPEVQMLTSAQRTPFSVNADFSGLGRESHRVEVSILTNDPEAAPFRFSILYEFEFPSLPDLAVYREEELYPDSVGTYNFASVTAGESQKVRFRLVNEGEEVLDLQDFYLEGDPEFTVSAMPELGMLLPGAEVSLEIEFAPDRADAFAAEAFVRSNDPDEEPYNFFLRAKSSPGPQPEIQVLNRFADEVPDGFEFIELTPIVVGATDEYLFLVRNIGEGTLNLGEFSIDHPDFQIFPGRKRVLESGEAENFLVRYTPSSVGEAIAEVSIENNDSDENPYNFKLRLSVREPDFRIIYKDTSIPDGLNTRPSETGPNRTLFVNHFDIIDPDNIVRNTTVLHVRYVFSTGTNAEITRTTSGDYDSRIVYGPGFDTFDFYNSIRFGAQASYVDLWVYLETSDGRFSNVENYRIERPAGANRTGKSLDELD